MLGLIFNDRECKEMEYLLRKELDEMLLDLSDTRLDSTLRKVIDDRYQIIFRMFSRFGTPKDLSKYIRNKKTYYAKS